ncbi:hypothetical protein P43SY_007148 [Pythium insidiosum]|uniref:Beta-lactamase-related domain-containing protein n=1 Tax=Pythium insidiosum TaxID=114742 RepID=A0AAD5Q475_PYTIN|nr:hypothetical protein P43SY_007148 [Pythium insidiosum]
MMKGRLSQTAKIVNNPSLESGLVRLQRGEQLSADEKRECAPFKIKNATPSISAAPDEAVSLVRDAFKRSKVTKRKTHIDVGFVPPTSNECERFFSCAQFVLEDHRKSMHPDTLEMIMILDYNRKYLEPEASLREKYAYSNTNYVILGQVIEGVSGQPWDRFLKERVWQPLGMNRTFASVNFIPRELLNETNSGHNDCVEGVTGPFDIVTAPQMQLAPGRKQGLLAAGSTVSTPSDMAIFMRMLLNKGSFNNVQVFESTAAIAEMIRGKTVLGVDPATYNAEEGFHFELDGNTVASGYGFDTVGQIMWDRTYCDKGGDTMGHTIRTGFSPTDRLGVAVFSNTESSALRQLFHVDQFRSYLMGIFLDVPTQLLEFEYSR